MNQNPYACVHPGLKQCRFIFVLAQFISSPRDHAAFCPVVFSHFPIGRQLHVPVGLRILAILVLHNPLRVRKRAGTEQQSTIGVSMEAFSHRSQPHSDCYYYSAFVLVCNPSAWPALRLEGPWSRPATLSERLLRSSGSGCIQEGAI